MNGSIVRALLSELCHDSDALLELADALAPLIAPAHTEDGWMDAWEAASYLALTRDALHKLTAARAIPFVQNAPNGKWWFKRSELDAWRAGSQVPTRPVADRRIP